MLYATKNGVVFSKNPLLVILFDLPFNFPQIYNLSPDLNLLISFSIASNRHIKPSTNRLLNHLALVAIIANFVVLQQY